MNDFQSRCLDALVSDITSVAARSGNHSSVDVERVNDMRGLWQNAMAHANDDQVLVAFERCTQSLQNTPVARNELMFALGRPVEREYVNLVARKAEMSHVVGEDAFDRAVRRLTTEAASSVDISELQVIFDELETLCNVGSPQALAVLRRLICMKLQTPLGPSSGLLANVRLYLQYQKVSVPRDASATDPALSEHLTLVNSAHKIVSVALGAESATLQWCRNFLLSCITVQEQALAVSALHLQHAFIKEAIAENKTSCGRFERRLNIAPETLAETVAPQAILNFLKSLSPTDALKKIIERCIRKCETGSPAERSHAEDFLTHVTSHPRYRCFADPQSMAVRTFTDATDRVRQVDAARSDWHAQIIGQDDLCEAVMHRLGTMLESGGVGYNLIFMGPPGVGKSLAAQVIALAHDRPLVTIQGEALTRRGQIAGNESMYVGTEPGAIARALLDCGKAPVILIDELGKADFDAQCALATVLDRSRNHTFVDVFLGKELAFDLTQVIFVITANEGEEIDRSILNRAQRFDFSPLGREDKKRIIEQAWSRERQDTNLPAQLCLSRRAVEVLVDMREEDPGVRQSIKTDLACLANWAHTKQDRGKPLVSIDAPIVKRVAEQSWADVTSFHDKMSFVADIRFGSIGLNRKRRKAELIFGAADRFWRLAVDEGHFQLGIVDGDPVPAYCSIDVRDAKGDKFCSISTSRLYFETGQAIQFYSDLPRPGMDKEWALLLERKLALNLRLVAVLGERWFAPRAALLEGAAMKQKRSGRYDI